MTMMGSKPVPVTSLVLCLILTTAALADIAKDSNDAVETILKIKNIPDITLQENNVHPSKNDKVDFVVPVKSSPDVYNVTGGDTEKQNIATEGSTAKAQAKQKKQKNMKKADRKRLKKYFAKPMWKKSQTEKNGVVRTQALGKKGQGFFSRRRVFPKRRKQEKKKAINKLARKNFKSSNTDKKEKETYVDTTGDKVNTTAIIGSTENKLPTIKTGKVAKQTLPFKAKMKKRKLKKGSRNRLRQFFSKGQWKKARKPSRRFTARLQSLSKKRRGMFLRRTGFPKFRWQWKKKLVKPTVPKGKKKLRNLTTKRRPNATTRRGNVPTKQRKPWKQRKTLRKKIRKIKKQISKVPTKPNPKKRTMQIKRNNNWNRLSKFRGRPRKVKNTQKRNQKRNQERNDKPGSKTLNTIKRGGGKGKRVQNVPRKKSEQSKVHVQRKKLNDMKATSMHLP